MGANDIGDGGPIGTNDGGPRGEKYDDGCTQVPTAAKVVVGPKPVAKPLYVMDPKISVGMYLTIMKTRSITCGVGRNLWWSHRGRARKRRGGL